MGFPLGMAGSTQNARRLAREALAQQAGGGEEPLRHTAQAPPRGQAERHIVSSNCIRKTCKPDGSSRGLASDFSSYPGAQPSSASCALIPPSFEPSRWCLCSLASLISHDGLRCSRRHHPRRQGWRCPSGPPPLLRQCERGGVQWGLRRGAGGHRGKRCGRIPHMVSMPAAALHPASPSPRRTRSPPLARASWVSTPLEWC